MRTMARALCYNADQQLVTSSSFPFVSQLRYILRRTNVYLHEEATVQYPQEGNQPTLGRVAAHGGPAEHQVEGEAGAGDEGVEEHQHQRGDVEDGLQRGDLAEDLEGGQLRQRAGPRGSPPSRHLTVMCYSLGSSLYEKLEGERVEVVEGES